LKPETIHVGDFVYCRSSYHRDQLELPQELGLVIEIKRSNFKVLYSNDKRCWLPRETLVRVHPELDYTMFRDRLYYLIKKVHAVECEITSGEGAHRVTLRTDQIQHETIDDLRHFLGEDFISLAVVPEGMAFMQVEIRFRSQDLQSPSQTLGRLI
jgi:hypothetical protein